jgi:uncharacterized protein (TIGR00369 family)
MADPIDSEIEAGIRDGFLKHGLMLTLGAILESVETGVARIRLPFSEKVTQHYDFVHAGAITAIVDTACGAAAISVAPPGSGLLTVEYKINFVSAAKGETFLATGRVVKAGKTWTICQGTVEDEAGVTVALMQATMMILKASS